MEAKLVVISGKVSKKEIPLKLPTVIGRSRKAGLTVAHPLVSREHCRIEEVDGALVVRDNKSLNGTFVGGARITEALLKPGDKLTVGPLTFVAIYQHEGAFPHLESTFTQSADGTVNEPAPMMGEGPSELEAALAEGASPATEDEPGAAAAEQEALPAAAAGPAAEPATPAESGEAPAAAPLAPDEGHEEAGAGAATVDFSWFSQQSAVGLVPAAEVPVGPGAPTDEPAEPPAPAAGELPDFLGGMGVNEPTAAPHEEATMAWQPPADEAVPPTAEVPSGQEESAALEAASTEAAAPPTEDAASEAPQTPAAPSPAAGKKKQAGWWPFGKKDGPAAKERPVAKGKPSAKGKAPTGKPVGGGPAETPPETAEDVPPAPQPPAAVPPVVPSGEQAIADDLVSSWLDDPAAGEPEKPGDDDDTFAFLKKSP